ncbi:hypothetical protein ES319_D05G240300v1 [Gossypium barbadense]|uniref:VQ domain-containing protein n=3 Tax=Gossypium TaxID=3633 RepID=A0ABM3A5T5_GOSHI|nr:uncharacterized protein LOC107902596 [Gossypium hirsutum]KAB2030555.1 hypothetical protein ES319_D05G240300v1 [Gossypium barbadense]TYG69698.1 hypothetical protein ES288_D05G251900v1 [Gossypium darwinii]
MDSSDSSSMQSASGVDEGCESPTESVPAFMNTNPLSNPHPSLVLHHQNHPPIFFDPSANYLNPFSQSQQIDSLLNIDGFRPLSQRPKPNCCTVDLGSFHLQGLSSSSQSTLGAQELNQGCLYPSSSSLQSRPYHDVRLLTKSDQKSVVKNPKKRTRASRTAPTTVLTTDTMNFRAIVQEFTGIPAPPFSGSSYSRRPDLFGSRSGMLKQTQNMLNLQNQSPLLSFQSFLHPTTLQPCLNLAGFGVNSHGTSAMPSIDDLGMSHGNEDHLRPLDHWNRGSTGTDQNSQRNNSCKLNYSASSSGFQHDKELENVSLRAEGTVDSWNCHADQ